MSGGRIGSVQVLHKRLHVRPLGSREPLSNLTTGKADESEGRDSQDLEDVEIVVIGTASEADASLHASAEGKALE